MQIREQGWECPKCERVWAPKVNACGACNARGTLGYIPLRPLEPRYHDLVPTNWNFTADDPSFTQ